MHETKGRSPDNPVDGFSADRCRWEAARIGEAEGRVARIEDALFSTNGQPGLIEVVRTIARTQKWQTFALLILLAMQVEAPLREILAALLRALVTR